MLAVSHYFLLVRHKDLGSEARLPRQMTLLLLTLFSIILIIIVSPLPESTRNQILALLGIALSGVIALSSTSFVTNFMAAVMLRVTRPFRVGDFISVGDLFGKVVERGLFDTEVQTENRELIAIPNATFITQPVTVARTSGVIVSTNLSLGYDLSFSQVEPLMLKAAAESGLTDPYVHITGLGDFSITYRVFGLLADVGGILTARSELNRELLLAIHGAGLEIVSPTVTRHINQSEDVKIIPQTRARAAARRDEGVKAEEIVFDKATEIAQLKQERAEIKASMKERREAGEASDKDTHDLQRMEGIEKQLQELKDKE